MPDPPLSLYLTAAFVQQSYYEWTVRHLMQAARSNLVNLADDYLRPSRASGINCDV